MEPLPEVRRAAKQLEALTDTDLVTGLDDISTLVLSLVPSCVGVSVTVIVDGEPFTITSTAQVNSVLDAVQYLDDGPCLEAAQQGRQVAIDDLLDEEKWQTFRQAGAAVGVRSSLSLPIGNGTGTTPGAINLYASRPDAFDGREEQVAAAFHVPVEQLVANADLSFMTRDFARQLPERLEHKAKVDAAVSVLRELYGWRPEEARSRLREAAARAAVPVDVVAEVVVALHVI